MTKGLLRFYIPAGTYSTGIYFLFGRNVKAALKYVNKLHKREYREESFHAKGCMFRRDGYHPIIWMPVFPSSPDTLDTLSHEILHGVKNILFNWAGMPLGDDSEEAYCHLQGYFTRKVLTKIKTIKKKSKITK